MIRADTASWTDPTLLEAGWYPPGIKSHAEKRLRYYAERFSGNKGPLREVVAATLGQRSSIHLFIFLFDTRMSPFVRWKRGGRSWRLSP